MRDGRRHGARDPLHVGQIIDGYLDQFGSSWQLQGAEHLMTQAPEASPESLYWQHHLLDIYYCYVPLEQPSGALFQLLSLCMRLGQAPPIVWKAAVVYLFSLLGYGVPKTLEECGKLLFRIDEHARTYNTANVLHIDWQKEYACDEQTMNRWLIEVLQQHAHYSLLKTHYLFGQLYGTVGSP